MSECITGRVSGGRAWSVNASRPVLPGVHGVGSGLLLYVYRRGFGVFRVLDGERWRPEYLLAALPQLYREGLRWEELVVTTDRGPDGRTVALDASPERVPSDWVPLFITRSFVGRAK